MEKCRECSKEMTLLKNIGNYQIAVCRTEGCKLQNRVTVIEPEVEVIPYGADPSCPPCPSCGKREATRMGTISKNDRRIKWQCNACGRNYRDRRGNNAPVTRLKERRKCLIIGCPEIARSNRMCMACNTKYSRSMKEKDGKFVKEHPEANALIEMGWIPSEKRGRRPVTYSIEEQDAIIAKWQEKAKQLYEMSGRLPDVS